VLAKSSTDRTHRTPQIYSTLWYLPLHFVDDRTTLLDKLPVGADANAELRT
jgi:hypothetical protein